jgi:mono/diheme cytochrome c family protein
MKTRRNTVFPFPGTLGALPLLLGLAVLPASAQDSQWGVVEQYCMECHNATDWAGQVAFDLLDPNDLGHDAETYEKAIRKLRGGLMPPPGAERPSNEQVAALAGWLATSLDAAAVASPAGRVPLRRLNRREYQNAIRDLLGLEIDASALLPRDDLKGGYDNNATALQVSPTFIDQYLNAARTIAHDAVGDRRPIPIMQTYGNVADMIISLPPRGTPGTGTQQRHNAGMPFGTRGGMSVTYNFLADGEYELTIGDLALAREVPNMEFENTVIALLDGEEFFRTVIGGEADHKAIDQIQDDAVAQINERLRKIRFPAQAGQHEVTVTFLQRSFAESDERSAIAALEGGQDRVHAIHALQIRGPLSVSGMSDSASRQSIFRCYPRESAEERSCASEIIDNLATRAFRRPLTQEDTNALLGFYDQSRGNGMDFETGVREALSAILVSPHFLYRAESGGNDGDTLQLSDLELASRLSFFLWSSLPDDELLALANEGKLSDDTALRAQIHRMLTDERAKTLVDDFAFQWLNLAKLDEIVPNRGLFPYASNFLDPRPLFKEELSLFIDSVLRSDQPVTKLLDADYTYLNERLAMHYGIGTVKGDRFRKVQLPDDKRYGLLGKGAVLMLTANPNRTSPVLRGAWILERLLGTPPSPPPPNVEALPENGGGAPARTVRERLEQHRANPTCFACHGVMDPLGMALENFDTVGQFRSNDRDTLSAIDASGVLPDGKAINGPSDLRAALVERSDMFVQTLTENLMTYGLGRELTWRDMPTVRGVVRAAAKDDYRFESIVYHVVTSDAFRAREGLSATDAPARQVTLQTGGL